MNTGYLDSVRKTWDRMGATDPLYAVMTEPGKQGGKWDLAEFWERGVEEVSRHLRILDACRDEANTWAARSNRTALDFGCGVGRLSRALALDWGYRPVIGLDIAPSMIAKAKEFHKGSYGLDFRVHTPPYLEMENNSIDLVLSLITLQHLQTEVQHDYLREFLRVLKPGGCAIVGMMAAPLRPPTLREAPQYAPNGEHWIMEMHGVDVEAAIRTVRNAGGRVLDVRYDRKESEYTDLWVTFTYYVQKEEVTQ